MENILITGASTGIGYSLAKIFLQKGCRVFGSVRKKEDADRLKSSLSGEFIPLLFDVVDHKAVEASVAQIKEVIGDEGLDCLINNAGIAVNGPILQLDLEDYQRQFDVNLFGVIAVTKTFLPLLGASKDYKKKPGKILNISSVSGEISFPFLSPYCASKHALDAFSDSLRREMLIYGIDVISIQPGPIKTPIWKKSINISEELQSSDYGAPIERFLKQVQKGIDRAMESDELAERVFGVYRKKKPRTRYVFMNDKFTNFFMPRYVISARKLDGIVRKLYFTARKS